ncbi:MULTISPECIES: aldehyde dehydrogenase family protein [Sphingobium]|jgi:aldehyde dehydrogenase (NAD+)|uniref:aldehyde dehydrogenase family protein n=1 Tax=Sphingobium TaxID=165695 RepID=UPI000C633592|nr:MULTISPECIES: aldehyde dehydrogenase family protein [Sphingobium]MBS48888.1 aldehyde dehydrogenase [Sphingobium sp.]MCC4256211.1 aldehyde dehydrogenase family protein [Sphingobium lactosutens]HCW62088.1 aldehyde dehydrogenase [Sphingobium sp.]|tara:strand:+ start:10285 stop:11760 length:1476 start_codon:yes stop_codon:yes gene_type:complete
MTILRNKNALYINGEWVTTTQTEAVINPATEGNIGDAPVGTSAHVEAAIAAAHEAFHKGPWPRLSQRERQAKMSEFLDAIDRRAQEIIALIVAEAGSTQMLAQFLQYGIPMQHARAAIELSGRPAITPLPVETTPNAQGTTTLGAGVKVRDPVGVVSAITPYNFPFFLNVGKVVPALLMGNTVILKPSPYTPFEALILGEIADEVGLPRGVFNIVTGDVAAGEALTTDKRIDLVSFTGSDRVGSLIQAQAAPTLKRLVMELGGKSALIVRPDADLQGAAMNGLMGFTVHCGQGCALLTRHLVHNSVKAQYIETLKAMVAHVKVGDPADPTSTMGPLIREVARTRTQNYVDIALSQGARLVTGGKRPAGLDKGFFYEPTLFTDVENHHRIAQEEVFGPIGVVIGYDTDEEAITIANDSDFGLSGAVFSADVGKAYEIALQLRTGGVAVNGGGGKMSSYAPFGGIKRSGYGREYGYEGINEFTNIKTISFKGG